MAKKQKYYVVWEGLEPGIYASWPDCQAAIKGYSNARYKSFSSRAEAEEAYQGSSDDFWGKGKSRVSKTLSEEQLAKIGQPIAGSLCVDAACSVDTGQMEYQGVWLDDSVTAFHAGPFPKGTNNIGEFLAIVHALAMLTKQNLDTTIYTDSATAMSWIRKKRANSKALLEGRTGPKINQLVQRATNWLKQNEYSNPILKWETKAWGEIPADFGRK